MLYIPLRKRSVLVKVLEIIHELSLKSFRFIFMGICGIHIPVLNEIEGRLFGHYLIRLPLVSLPTPAETVIIHAYHEIVCTIIKVKLIVGIINHSLTIECRLYRLIHTFTGRLSHFRRAPYCPV